MDLGGRATSAGRDGQGKEPRELAGGGGTATPLAAAALGAPVFSDKSAGRGGGGAAQHTTSPPGNHPASVGGRRAGPAVEGSAGRGNAKRISLPSPLAAAAVAAEVSSDEWEEATFEATLVATPRSEASSQVRRGRLRVERFGIICKVLRFRVKGFGVGG